MHDHLDDTTLAALTDGALEGPAREAAEGHLADCEACRAGLGDLVHALEEGGASAPAGLADRILAGVPIERARPQGGVMHRFRFPIAAAALVLVAVGLFAWNPGTSDRTGPGGGRDDIAVLPDLSVPPATPAAVADVTVPARAPELGGETRYLAHISTDKPVYKPGEMMYARAVLLDAFTHRPYGAQDGRGRGAFILRSARGEIVLRAPCQAEDGVAAFHWQVPGDQAGGEYKLAAAFPLLGTPEAEQAFDVRAYRVPRLRTDLQFLSKAYGAGDRVHATLEALRAEGGPSANALATAIARVDGREVYRKDIRLDRLGRCAVAFDLPADIAEGIGTLALRIRDGGITETAAKTLPIVVAKVDLAFYPEGGDLVAGVPCGLYFEARNVRKDPADVAGRIVDDRGTEVATFASEHEGRGRCVFTPVVGRTYRAVLSKPSGIVDPVLLPTVEPQGFSLRAPAPSYRAGKTVGVIVASTSDTAATVGLYVRERELALQPVRLAAGSPVLVRLDPAQAVSGVLRVTVFDRDGSPKAERLVFAAAESGLSVSVTPESDATVPAGKVRFEVVTRDALGRPVPAVVGLAATDDAVLATIDPRERAPRLPVQALLGSDVRELKDAHVYLASGEDGATRTDLLLGTQGWRRFCFYDHPAFLKTFEQQGRRALANATPRPPTRGGGIAVFGAGRGAGGPREDKEDGGPDEVDNDVPRDGAAAPRLREFFKKLKPGGAVPPNQREPHDPSPPPPPPPTGPPMGQPVPVDDPIAEAGEKDDGENARRRMRPMGRRLQADEFMPGWVRVYAHAADAERAPGVRNDFTETVYWHAGLKTDAEGRATIEFDASDSITTIRLRADGVSADGALGGTDATVEVKRPFYVEPKFPLEVSAGDRVDMPLALVNGTDEKLPVTIEATVGEGLRLVEGALNGLEVPAAGSLRHVLSLAVGDMRGTAALRVRVTAGPYRDEVVRAIQVVPAGFPIEHGFGGVLSDAAEHTITIPDKVLPGSVTSETAVYPTPLASMAEALEGMLREPHGCFEQTSSTNYPNVMALQYMRTHQGVAPALVAKATAMLERGYKRLVSFECKEKGYEWFGGDPGHEALSAYGVLEFHDMAQVMQVDGDMVKRTRTWLLGRRDGKGGFKRNPRALDSFGGAPEAITNAYILWALLEAGTTDLEAEIAAVKASATASKDSYLHALAANALWLAEDRDAARRLLDRIAAAQEEDGHVGGAKTTITRSGGKSLHVETTSLAVLGWLRHDGHNAQIEKAMRWLAAQCQRGRFGSTQSTVLALKAINAYDAKRATVTEPGVVRLLLNGQPVGEVPFAPGHQGPIRLPNLAEKLTPGRHTIRLEMDGGGAMPYALSIRYAAMTPASAEQAIVRVGTTLAMQSTVEGEPVEIRVRVENTSAEGQPMAVAVVGLPGGLEARAAQLKELVREGKVDFVETRGRDVVLYWRSLAPNAQHDLVVDCIAAVPGTYEGPASRAYLYYTDEHKHWIDGLTLEIKSK